MAESSSSSSAGIGLSGLLTVIFVCAKVFGFEPVASWSWWLVLCPLWIGLAIFLGILSVIGIGILIAAVVSTISENRSYRKHRP